ncbi:MAG TPA: hypothetical protein VGQ17_06920 [Gemmatimonadales bacterium]|nr:hypothetical protein [Gemmatimonadales bacterium]
MALPEGRKPPWPVAVVGLAVISLVAVFSAWVKALRGELNPTWNPTRRG